jgi:Fe-S-cluster-containing hydrogenase component 2
MKTLVPYPEKCTGCRFCEMICPLAKENVVNPKKARLRIVRKDVATDTPVVCTQCGECIEACPQDAISKDNDVVKIDSGKCVGCGLCAEACPYNVITLINNVAVKCDLCNGDPVCVKYCSQGGIKFEEVKA